MGQYFIIVNLDKKEYLEPSMAKLTEFSWRYSATVNYLLKLLGGKWAGDRVVVAGDYAEWMPEDIKVEVNAFNKENPNEEYPITSIYSLASETYTEVFFSEYTLRPTKKTIRTPWEMKEEDEKAYLTKVKTAYTGKCLLFEDLDAFIDLGAYYEKEEARRSEAGEDIDWIESPHTILLATNDGRGGGDYCGANADYVVGMFLGERARVVRRNSKLLKGCKEVGKDIIIDESYKPEPAFEAEGMEGEEEAVA